MRSLFHFPLPCTTTLAVTVSYSNRPTAPEMSRRPHPAPMRRQRRSPVLLSAARPLPGPALTGPWPTVTRSQGARHAAPPSLPRAAARSHRAPSPEYRPAAPAPIGLASSASRPSRAVARIPLSRCVGPGPLAGKNRTVCIPFSPNARERPPSWQHPPEMHAFRDQDGNILALCIHFRAQSGDSGYMARESCRQGPTFASRNPKSRMARRCCQRRTAFPRQRHAIPVPMHLATCAPHPSRQPRGPTASREQAEQHKQLNAGIKIGSPNRDPIEELFGFAQRLPDALQPLHQANELALSYLDHSTRQRLGGYVIGLSGNSFTVDLYAALVDHATSIAC